MELHVQGLTKHYPGVAALDTVSGRVTWLDV